MTNVLATKAILAEVNISLWTARKYDKKVSAEVNAKHNAADDAGRYNKLLVAKEAIKDITNVAVQARLYHYQMTQAWMDQGPRLLATANYMKHTKLREQMVEFDKLADTFAKNYPAMVEDAKTRLKTMFNAEDYPDPSSIRGKFQFKINYLPCPDASDFRVSLSDEVMDEMKSDLESRMTSALDNAMKDARERIIEVVGHMAEKLKGYSGAREGAFRDSLVENVRSLVDLLPAFNLTNDPKLTAIIGRMEKHLCAVDADDLREDKAEREYVAKQADKILKEVSEFLA